jgi:hypothetical protein
MARLALLSACMPAGACAGWVLALWVSAAGLLLAQSDVHEDLGEPLVRDELRQ